MSTTTISPRTNLNDVNPFKSTDISAESIEKTYILLNKPKVPYQSLGQGLHNGVFYYGTFLEDEDNKLLSTVITSDRRIFVDYGKTNEIRNSFGLKYRDEFFGDIISVYWSNKSIQKWLNGYSVDLKDVFNRLKKTNKNYMRYENPHLYSIVPLDIMRSYFYRLFHSCTRTFFNAALDSGKTHQMQLYKAFCFNPVDSTDITPSSIYRIIESVSPTVLIDDFDLIPEKLRNLYISHIRKNFKPSKSIRSDGGSKGFRPQAYDSFSPLMFNNIGGLYGDNVTLSRVLTIRLLRHPEMKNNMVNYQDPSFSGLRDDLYVCGLQYWKEILDSYNNISCGGLTTRKKEMFQPYLAISNLISNDLYDLVLAFAEEYVQQEKIKDLVYDWEYNIYLHLWDKVKDVTGSTTEVDVSIAEISGAVASRIPYFDDVDNPDYPKKLHKLKGFIGKILSSGDLFKKTIPKGLSHYKLTRESVLKLIKSKDWMDKIVKETPEVTSQEVLPNE